ncbi:MAG TPA: hypothetical protein VG013_03810 [Gemmataceae bacterium]|jgi:hypothetical protein|nr:hypothetical protein [Gemmataceae bacterium]
MAHTPALATKPKAGYARPLDAPHHERRTPDWREPDAVLPDAVIRDLATDRELNTKRAVCVTQRKGKVTVVANPRHGIPCPASFRPPSRLQGA